MIKTAATHRRSHSDSLYVNSSARGAEENEVKTEIEAAVDRTAAPVFEQPPPQASDEVPVTFACCCGFMCLTYTCIVAIKVCVKAVFPSFTS